MEKTNLTDNIKNIIKTIGKESKTLDNIAQETNKNIYSVRSSVNVNSYKKYFIVNNIKVNDKDIKSYSLSQEGLKELDLILNQKGNN